MNHHTRQKPDQFNRHPEPYRFALALAIVSGVFSFIVCTLLVANYVQLRTLDPLNNTELLLLRKQLAAAPAPNQTLIEQIRALDLLARKAYFNSQGHVRVGGYLLAAGLLVFLITFRLAARWNPKTPEPSPPPPPESYWRLVFRAREQVTIAAIALAAVGLVTGYLSRSEIASIGGAPVTKIARTAPKKASAPGAAATPAPSFPSWNQVELQWPSFRGPGGIGVAHFATAPRKWDIKTGTNVRWKANIPLPGKNSPVVWGNHVFLTGATKDKREVYCYNGDTGKLLWTKTLAPYPTTPAKPPKVGDDTGYAAPTAVVQGDRVCAIFANGDITCLDFSGKELWGMNLGVPDDHYGHASSLIALDNLVFVQLDADTNSHVVALDLATGKQVWLDKRKYPSWASPSLIKVDGRFELILNSNKDVDAYDPHSGKHLWTVGCLDGEVAPSPAFAKDTLFVANEYATATALRFKPSDPGPPHKIWDWSDILPDISSPVGTDNHFYIAASSGEIACLNLQSGKKVWIKRFDQGYASSPVVVGDCIYLLDRDGLMHIFKNGDTYQQVAAIPFNEPGFATPAFLDGRIYARVGTHLYCIAKNAAS